MNRRDEIKHRIGNSVLHGGLRIATSQIACATNQLRRLSATHRLSRTTANYQAGHLFNSQRSLNIATKMTSRVLSCHGCLSAITTKSYLNCCLCAHIYDLLCANITVQRFLKTMSKEAKSSWKCPECINKVPKAGNINTPVGAAHGSTHLENQRLISPVSAQNDDENVTIHRGSSGSNARRVLEHSYAEDTYYLDNIRTIIRDELERVMEERVSTLITKLVTEQVTLPINKIISELTDRVATLEEKLRACERNQTKANTNLDEVKRRTDTHSTSVMETVETTPRVITPTTQHVQSSSCKEAAPFVNNEPTLNITVNESAGPGWTQVTKKRSRGAPVGVIRGAATPGSTTLEAAERRQLLHLYYVKVGTTAAEVLEHLHSKCDGNTCTVEELKARGNYASFKLDVPSKLANIIMSPNNWPEDICIKPWRQSFRP